MKYKYKLSSLDCAGCALNIEKKLNENSDIKSASVNFSKLLITVETDSKNPKKLVSSIVDMVEPDSKVLDLNEVVENKSKLKFHVVRLILGILFSIIGIFVFEGKLGKIFIILGYAILLYRTFTNAVKLLIKSKTINENLLVTISCVGAYFTNNIHEGLMVIILYEIGKILEEVAINNSRKSISSLMDIKPEYANLKVGKRIEKVDPNLVNIDNIIIVKKGEKLPLDGIIVKGSASLDTAALTGESKLRDVKEGDAVLSGSINMEGLIEVKVTSAYENSTVSKILELTENASDRKAKTENFVGAAAKIYTPIIIILAILIVLILPLFKINFNDAIYRALVFLVVSCPCAIAISVPLGYFSGIGRASLDGILVKGSDYLEALSDVSEIVFDKTGTITSGVANGYELDILDNKYKKDDVINYLVKGEMLSNHPVAKSILKIFNQKVKADDVKNFKEHSGKGLSFEIKKDKFKIGSSSFVKFKINDNRIYLSINESVVAALKLIDDVKKDSPKAIEELKNMNIKTFMFTGDNKDVALEIAKRANIDNVKYEMLPIDKYNELEKLIKNNKKKTAFVGDGINDAPSLALSSVGISMGGVGSSSAIEASDVVIMNDSLLKIPKAIKISKLTKKIIKQNLIFAIGVKVLVLLLSFFGIASMWQAVFADTGVTLLAILNTTRIFKK
mgnify:FL=1